MQTFKSYLSEQKNTHMTHIEDQVIYGGVKGARDAILALRSLRDMLAGSAKGSTDVTVKWDGAPAVFAGIDPADGQFFVAKKGIFNKNPKVYKSHEDIEADTSGDLQTKLKIAYDELSKLGIRGVVQGDIMFTASDLKTETIDGQKYITFHPNTIMYALPVDSEHNNRYVRAGEAVKDTKKHVDNLIQFISDKFEKEAGKRSTEKGKAAQYAKRDEILKFFSDKNKANLKLVFDLQKAIVVAKLIIINKLDRLKSINTFVKTKTGFKVTGQEGFVAIDRIGGGAVKLVDRLEFSTNNFSPDILKGWDTPSRS
jgi:hypothetical protein